MLKLRHDGFESNTTCGRRRSGGGWSERGWRSHRLSLWLFWSKLGLAPSNVRAANGTHNGERSKLRIGGKNIAKDLCDSRKEVKLITGRHILIDIYKGEYEMRGKVNGKPLKEE